MIHLLKHKIYTTLSLDDEIQNYAEILLSADEQSDKSKQHFE